MTKSFAWMLRAEIEKLARLHGSQATLAGKLGISATYLSDLIHGRKPLSARVANKLTNLGGPGFDLFIQQAREALDK